MSHRQFLFWLPRIIAIIYILFLAIFALDVFIPGRSIGETLIALFMHLLPNFALLTALFIAWRKEKFGGILFVCLGILFTFAFQTYLQWTSFLIVSLPAFVIGVLFVLRKYW